MRVMRQECFRPIGPAELELVRQSGYRRWPPRLLGQPFFYPVTNEDYARVKKSFMDRYPVRTVGGERHRVVDSGLGGGRVERQPDRPH